MLTGGYQILDLSGTVWTDHTTYYDCTNALGVELGKKFTKALKKGERMEIVVGGNIKVVHGEDDVENLNLAVIPVQALAEGDTGIAILPNGYVLAEANFLMTSEAGMTILASLA